MTTFLLAMAYAVLGLWLLFALARVHAAWETGQRRSGDLRKALTNAGLKLLSDLETIQRLEDNAKRVRDAVTAAACEQQERHAAAAKSTRPPPPEIHVTSEYPTSAKDTAWVVSFTRHAEFPPQPWEREPQTSLVWADAQSAALFRARRIAEDCKTYSVASVHSLR